MLDAYVLSGVVYTVWFLLKNSSFSEICFFSLHDILKSLDIEKPRAQIFKVVVLICPALDMQSYTPKLPSTSLRWYPTAFLGNMSWTILVVSSYVLPSHVSPVLAADKCNQGLHWFMKHSIGEKKRKKKKIHKARVIHCHNRKFFKKNV